MVFMTPVGSNYNGRCSVSGHASDFEWEILSSDFLSAIFRNIENGVTPGQIGAIVTLVASTKKLLKRFDTNDLGDRAKAYAEVMLSDRKKDEEIRAAQAHGSVEG